MQQTAAERSHRQVIKRYPCQAVILFVLGILTAEGIGLCQTPGQADPSVWMMTGAAAAALASGGIWAGRERIWWRKICLAAVLAAAYGTGMVRMYLVSDALKCRTAGMADGQRVTVQGKIIKKQCRDTQQSVNHISNLNTTLVDLNRKSDHQFNSDYQFNSDRQFNSDYQFNSDNQFNSDHINSEHISSKVKYPEACCRASGPDSSWAGTNRTAQNLNNSSVSAETRQWTIYLADAYLSTEEGIRFCGNVIVYVKCAEPVIGNTVLLTGRSILFQTARNDGSFDERAYYQNQGYSFKIYADDNSVQIAENKKDLIREFLYAVQQKLLQVYAKAMDSQEAGALSAMLLGEKSLLLSQTKELYRRSGISHILAISGLHISILGASAYQLLRKCGMSYMHASLFAMGMLLLFVLMTGMGLSAVRAVVMFGIYLGAACAGRAYDSVNGLAAAAACILAYNPRALFLAAFQFSFAAVAGVLFGREICRIFEPRLKLTETVMISAGIQIFTLPLTAWYYYEIPLYSVLLNLFVLPFVEIVLITGLLGGGFGLIYGIFGMLSDVLLSVCERLLWYFAKAGELFLELPKAVCVIGRPESWQMICYYMTVAGCAWIMIRAADQRFYKQPQTRIIKLQKYAVVFGMLSCAMLLSVRLPKRQEVVFLDIGQGDGIYIHTSDGMDIFIDGGSTDVKNAGTYRILPFLKSHGVDGIDVWFVSHLDKDHVSGLKEAAESGYQIGQVVFAKGVVQDEAYADLLGLLDKQQILVHHLGVGEKLRGTYAGFTCLWPSDTLTTDDRNAASLVLLYEDRGFRAFFSGDLSSEQEKQLLAGQGISHVTLYKAAHHGSKYSNSKEILQCLKPDISVISCAEENDYGHPGREAVELMEQYSGCVYYTMHSGQIGICQGSKGVHVQEYLRSTHD